ncbi:double-stranded RNA-binding protein 4 isoform X1 [Sesamum indicum]|uniref:Double-stranded RNA-binding protein 4 isoform X1 n=2 Tax=Sesamum indicum TaxID=4182 RepID=A0A6I9U8A5_SESIN|nr:double-stranded RNA-binding protein 4 isoform X1 [Sesamum indicum]
MSVPPDPLRLPPPGPGIPEDFWFKNRLQEFTQKASIPLPIYQTSSEGVQHAPRFRSRVWVDGTCFASPSTFSNRKMAEQDAAKHALIGIQEKVKNEGSSRVHQDSIFCKSIIYEYAQKMNLQLPTYVTNESKAMLPIFVSSLVLNGVTYVGEAGKNKKEAEQFAARSAILSILDSESSTTMSEIVKSKFKLYDALKTVMDSSSVQVGNVPARVNPLEDSAAISLVNKRKEIDVAEGSSTDPCATISKSSSIAPFPAIQLTLPESTPEELSNTQAAPQFLHEFKKPKSQTSLPVVDPPIVFVPPASEPAVISSTSGKKRNRKNKKTKKKVLDQPPLTIPSIPQSLPAFSVAPTSG